MARGKAWEERFPNPHTRPDLDDPYTSRIRASAKAALGHDVLEVEVDFAAYLEELRERYCTPEHQAHVAKKLKEAEESAEIARNMEYRRNLERLSPIHVDAVRAGCDPKLNPITTTDIQRQVIAKWDGVQSMFLLGKTGIGKTYTATWCAMRAALRGADVASTTATRVHQSSLDGILVLRNASVLVLDQLHTLRSPAGKDLPAWQVGPVVDLIDFRYEHKLTTIAAGTIGPEAMVDLLGEDVKRRFPVRLASESTEIRRADR